MRKSIKRRDFLETGTKGCIACIALLSGRGAFARSLRDDDELPELTELCYCGYQCPEDCKILRGTLEKDEELLKEAYKDWGIKERFDIEFDPEVLFCYKCKNPDKPEGLILKNCTVRKCTMEKELECCVECNELTGCDKDLWTRFPEFHDYVIELQKKYQEEST
jgi:hypothetical protein